MLKPRDYQTNVLPRLMAGHHLLWWDAGTGKTWPMLVSASKHTGKTLYLGPPVIRSQVKQEALNYGAFSEDEIQIIGSGKDKLNPTARLIICSYDHLINIEIWKQFFATRWDVLILDEAHLLKSPTSKRTKAIYGVARNSKGALFRSAKKVWAASGTPLVNDPSDLWMHVSRLFPDVLIEEDIHTKDQFIVKFCLYKDTPYGMKIFGGRNLDRLKTIMTPISSRVEKSNLPPLLVTETWIPPVELDLSKVPEDALEALHDLLRQDDPDVRQLEHLAPALASLRRQIGLAKAVHATELMINEIQGGDRKKTILFYHHKDVGATVLRTLNLTSIGQHSVHYPGGLSQVQRDKVIHSFVHDPKCKVLVAQIEAAGTGLNLQQADRVIILEPAWTPALNEQAISRAWRTGQENQVWASFVVLSNSLDSAILSVLRRKSDIIRAVMGVENAVQHEGLRKVCD